MKLKQNDYSIKHLSFRIFKDYIRADLKNLIITLFCLLIIAATTTMNAWLIKPILDDIFSASEKNHLMIIPLVIICNSIVKAIADFYQNSTIKIIGHKIVTKLQKELYAHLIYSDLKLFHDHSSGKLLSRFTNEVTVMKKAFTEVFIGIIRDGVTLIALFGLILYQNFIMSLIFLIICPLIFIPIIKLGQRVRALANRMQDELANFAIRLDETFKNITLIKSYCRENYELAKADKVLDQIVKAYQKSVYLESSSSPLLEIIVGLILALALWYGGTSVIEGKITTGEFFSCITALMMSHRPLKAISQIHNNLQEGFAVAQRIFLLLDQKPLIKESKEARRIKFDSYDIEFQGVSFAYKKGKRKVLDNFNMKIASGTTVALVGTSGVGKSTILQLLQRFYDPDNGKIMISKESIYKMTIDQLRNSIAFVSQDLTLFDETIAYNIGYGKIGATEEEIIAAAKAASADDFIKELPEGYNSPVGQAGVKLSGGQKQRIAIARALLKNAPILLLDEATSALDSISEKKVQEALNLLKKGRTTIVIAHKISTIETADSICVIDNGKILDRGTHEELLGKSERYKKLYSYYKYAKNEKITS